MAKRAAGSGETPRKWKDRWRARITVGFDAQGRQVQAAVYGQTMGECQARIDALREEQAAGRDLMAAPETLGDYLESWLAHKKLEVAFNTHRDYETTIGYVAPLIGRVRLDKLTAQHVKKAQAQIYEQRSPRAARQALGLLRNALNDAERENLVRRNVARLVKPLQYTPAKFPIWSAEEVVRFITVAEPCAYYALFRTALTLGLRVGELMALEWQDITDAKLHVQRTAKLGEAGMTVGIPKTDNANRILHLPPDAIELLVWHHGKLDRPKGGLVFPTERGTMANHSNLSRSLTAWAKRAEVTEIRVHDLRHTYASMRISQGADPVTLSRELGHHSPAFTMERYAHFFERAKPRSAPSLMELVGADEGPENGPAEAGKVIRKVISVPESAPN